MGQKTYWHNVTKNVWNVNCLVDIVEQSDPYDDIRFSRRGSALVYDLRYMSDEELEEFEHVRVEFVNWFKNFHEVDFYLDKEKG